MIYIICGRYIDDVEFIIEGPPNQEVLLHDTFKKYREARSKEESNISQHEERLKKEYAEKQPPPPCPLWLDRELHEKILNGAKQRLKDEAEVLGLDRDKYRTSNKPYQIAITAQKKYEQEVAEYKKELREWETQAPNFSEEAERLTFQEFLPTGFTILEWSLIYESKYATYDY